MSLDAAQEVVVEVAAPIAECFDTILDFERYPEWSSMVKKARIVERDAAGAGKIVEYSIDMKIRSVRYVLDYAYKKNEELTWHSIDGDVKSVEGFYRFRELGPDRTEARCRQEIQLGFWVPGPLRRIAEHTALKSSVDEFKKAAEKRAAAKKAAGPKA